MVRDRYTLLRSLFPGHVRRLLDVGCGPILDGYRFADLADEVVCNDWHPVVRGALQPNVRLVQGDFLTADVGEEPFDVIILADVLEHIAVEAEPRFVARLVGCLRPGGSLLVSVPHRGTFAYLDPYHVKPAVQQVLWRLGLYRRSHNGACDVRKLHKHYRLEELQRVLGDLPVMQTRYWGYLAAPLRIWAERIRSRCGVFPGQPHIERWAKAESGRDFGTRSYNMVARFVRPPIASEALLAAVGTSPLPSEQPATRTTLCT